MRHLLVDRGLLLALGLKYGLYALWGMSSLIFGILPIRDLSGREIELTWAALIAVLSTIIVVSIARSAEKVEIFTTSLWIGVASLFPVALVARLLSGDLSTPHPLFIALGFLVVPTWRLSYLIRKNMRKWISE